MTTNLAARLDNQLRVIQAQLDQMSTAFGSTAHLHPQVVEAWDALHDAAAALKAAIATEQHTARRGLDHDSWTLIVENAD